MLKFAIRQNSPVAIRYPRGEAYDGLEEKRAPIELGRSELLYQGSEIALLAVGSMVKVAQEVYNNLRAKGQPATLINMRFVKPLDTQRLDELTKDHRLFVTLEENVKNGGFGEKVMDYFGEQTDAPQVRIVAIEDQFVPHGSVSDLMKQQRMDAESVTLRIEQWMKELDEEQNRREE